MDPEVNYTCRATPSKIVDADTVDLYIDCGFGINTQKYEAPKDHRDLQQRNTSQNASTKHRR